MTSKLLLSAAAAAAFTVPGIAQAQRAPAATIIIVDTDRIYAECTACKAALTQLQSKQTQAQARQQALATSLRAEAQAIQTAVNALNGMALSFAGLTFAASAPGSNGAGSQIRMARWMCRNATRSANRWGGGPIIWAGSSWSFPLAQA